MKINAVLKKALENVEPSKEEIKEIEASLKKIKEKISKNLKVQKIKAEIFVGGSFAKNTLIRKDKYDIDLYVRFDKKYKDKNLSSLTKKALKGFKVQEVHGSRDYFRVKVNKGLYFEIIPVLKINKPQEAENITDLSYSHVNYIKKKIKSKKLIDDIRLAKAFCYANKCYGAESYIKGFSGYGLELLIYHYKGFVKFLKAMTKIKYQEIIDIEKHHKNKKLILMNLNASKLNSPIILIDPTFKNRNALSALNHGTFRRFQQSAKKFLKSPSIKSFNLENLDFDLLKSIAKKKKLDFVVVEIKTTKQEGDIAGSKLLKVHNHLKREIKEYFIMKNDEFEYTGEKTAKCFFAVQPKKEIIFSGPSIKNKVHAKT